MFQRSIITVTFLLLSGLLVCSLPAHATNEACETWPAWDSFRQKFVSGDGRVVDRSRLQHVTTSEGQAYAMVFALIANDRTSFDQILRWVEDNLANGDLTSQLPAWNWGQLSNGSWGVIDGNAASDADLWLAYALNEAGRLWKAPKYTALAGLLAARILREETAEIPGLGLALLPGPKGFHPDTITWQLNPSYFPIQVMRRFSVLYPESDWSELLRTSIEIITRSAPLGFAPEWIDYQLGKGFLTAHSLTTAEEVGFNAIRVYLWAGMLDSRDATYSILLDKLAPMGRYAASNGPLARGIPAPGGMAYEKASVGFSSALLPFLKASRLGNALHQQRQRIVALAPLDRTDNYYDQVLTLFGLGWLEGYYKFDRNGQLKPRWKCTKK